jgi:Alw26I/Eco31I/Esp3I family type II restriction m6 adenine DNA methyltransferase
VRHVEVAVASSHRADLAQRLLGRFYSPAVIADRLASAAVRSAGTICDPFCGDGRLITAWLTSGVDLTRVTRVALYDYDAQAVAVAVERVRAVVPNAIIDAAAGDTFERPVETFDLVLTNPPWELLKPDTRDGLRDASSFRHAVRSYAQRIGERYPEALGHGVNLARAGALAAIDRVRDGGHLGIVLPASLLADRASSAFRAALFGRIGVERIESYPAEAKLFADVDQPFVTLSGVRGGTSSCTLRRHDANLRVLDERVLAATTSAPLPLLLGAAQCELVERVQRAHPALASLEGLWLGRELDETRLAESLTTSRRGVPFLKGRQVFPFRVAPGELRIDPSKRAIPATVRERRLAWRDVARPSLKRRMHVALVPDGHVTGNSLGIGFFRDRSDRIAQLMAVMNSFLFELQVRAELATAHVSLGIVRRCAVPPFAGSLRGPSPALEVSVARAYGLDRDAFATVLDAFPALTADERAAHLSRELWR